VGGQGGQGLRQHRDMIGRRESMGCRILRTRWMDTKGVFRHRR
jgi:hypothetical protein